MITLYNYFTVKKVNTSMSIIPTKEENKDDEIIYMKNITIDLEFENTIYYNNSLIKVLPSSCLLLMAYSLNLIKHLTAYHKIY